MPDRQIHRGIAAALRRCQKPTEIRCGSKHFKIYVGGKMIGVITHNPRVREGRGEGAAVNLVKKIEKADKA